MSTYGRDFDVSIPAQFPVSRRDMLRHAAAGVAGGGAAALLSSSQERGCWRRRRTRRSSLRLRPNARLREKRRAPDSARSSATRTA